MRNLRWKQWKTVCPEGILIIVIAFFGSQYMVFRTQKSVQDDQTPTYVIKWIEEKIKYQDDNEVRNSIILCERIC